MTERTFRVLLSAGAFLAALCGLAIAQEPAPAAANAPEQQKIEFHLVQKEMFVPAPGVFPRGLDVLEVYYTLPGKHPLVVLTHGTAADQETRSRITPWAQMPQAQWFARRGYVAMVVVRAGYGRSGGKQDTQSGGCHSNSGSFQDAGEASTQDLRAVMDYARTLPEVDATTILSAGVSTGGFAQVALSAGPPPGLKAAISFAGGRGGDGHENNCDLPGVIDAFKNFGKQAHKHGDLPMLWIYSENDHWFPPAMARQFEAAYTKSGASIQFLMVPPDGNDGHHLYMHVAAWSDVVEGFLKAHNLLPLGDRVLPEPLPPNIPMPAALKATDAETWRRFLLVPPFKTLVADEKGALWISGAGFDQSLADDAAKEKCKSAGGAHCIIVARTPGAN
ncbi:MAG: dienelactone hydrolase family protein [Terracidiphilus sp.]|jgi:dienelactone hydrolase